MRTLIRALEEAAKSMHVGVAETILRHLGGRRFMAMTGAKNMSAFGELDSEHPWPGLKVQFPIGNAKYMNVALAPSDTYYVQFLTRSGKVISDHDDIYADSLVDLIERKTGLALSL